MVCQIGFNFLAGVSELKWQIGLIRYDEALITCDSSSDFMVVCPGRIQLNRRKARALGHIDYKVAQKSTRALVIYDKSRKVNTTLRLMFSLCNILRIRRVASHSLKSFFMIMYLTYILIKGGVGVANRSEGIRLLNTTI